MKFSTVLASVAFASSALALPGNWNDWVKGGPLCPPANNQCLTQADADDIVAKFISLLDHPDVNAANATAQALIGPNFFEKSDSINMLAGHPVSLSIFLTKSPS